MAAATAVVLVLTGAADGSQTQVAFFTTDDCTGSANLTVDLSGMNNTHCTGCWDRCQANPPKGLRAFVVEAADPAVKVALNGNCIGLFTYLGGWSGTAAANGGVCHKGVPSAMVLCSGTAAGLQDDLDEVCGTPLPAPPDTQPDGKFVVLDPDAFAAALGDDLSWAKKQAPFLELDGLENTVEAAFYYRTRVLRQHVKWTLDGWVLTEFLPYVPWSGRHNTIPAAAGHHITDARWLHDPAIHQDYSTFWYQDRQMLASFGGTTSYTQWIGWATYNAFLVTGNLTHVETILPKLAAAYRDIYIEQYKAEAGGELCWKQSDGADAMEVSISGPGCRPTIASVMWGEAAAIVKMAQAVGNATLEAEFKSWVDTCAEIVINKHWNPVSGSFAVIPLAEKTGSDADAATTESPRPAATRPIGHDGSDPMPPNCNLSAIRVVNKTVAVRELLGFMPFYYPDLLPAEKIGTFMPMWDTLFDPSGFKGPFGLRTAERRSPCYNYSWSHGDCWNGPSWPYETARVLTSAAHLLNNHPEQVGMTKARYNELLLSYAQQHTATNANNDTAHPVGSGHVFENVHADTGWWNNRRIMYANKVSNRDQGNDYSHSTFIDLVITGLIGVRPGVSGDQIVVNPITLPGVKYFCLDGLKYRGHWVTVLWDLDGSKYAKGAGLSVFVDGLVAKKSVSLRQLTVPLH